LVKPQLGGPSSKESIFPYGRVSLYWALGIEGGGINQHGGQGKFLERLNVEWTVGIGTKAIVRGKKKKTEWKWGQGFLRKGQETAERSGW